MRLHLRLCFRVFTTLLGLAGLALPAAWTTARAQGIPPSSSPPGERALDSSPAPDDEQAADTERESDDEWEGHVAAPTVTGPVGLFRMQTAEVGAPLHFRVGLHLQGLRQNNFLIGDSSASSRDKNSRILGDLTAALTLPNVTFIRHLELYLAIFNASNENLRRETGRLDPQVILSLGDVGFGVKGAWRVARGLSLGGHVGARFFNSVSGVIANFAASTVSFDGLATLDIRAYAPRVPIRLHFNGGYFLDRSLRLLPPGQCSQSDAIDACIRSRVVETFAFGLGVARARFAFGLELPFRPHTRRGGIVGVAPFGEYHIERAHGTGDSTVAGALASAGIPQSQIDAALIQYVTAGLRLRPTAGLIIDAGVDIGIASPGFRYGPPVPAYNVILGIAYAYGPARTKTRIVTRTIIEPAPPAPVAPRIVQGYIRGTVRDAITNKPISGAAVRYVGLPLSAQLTGEDGSFVSYPLAPGEVHLEAAHEDYDTIPTTVTVQDGRDATVDLLLAPRPKESKVRVHAVDEHGAAVPNLRVHAAGPATRDATPAADGALVSLPAGEYALTIEAPEYLAKERSITVEPMRDQNLEVTLRRRPQQTHVTITREAIVIRGTIHFGTNNAIILPDGQQLLDEVVDVLTKNPQIRKVSIEGHTDNRGSPARNLRLSKARAEAVRTYLIMEGISPMRLVAQGFGAARPLAPNMTPANRARNRRVEFRIIESGE